MPKPRSPLPPGEVRVVGPGFHARVWERVREVPPGTVTTYGDVASSLGSPRVARQVGWALAALLQSPDGDDVPWHRVINAKGTISFRGDVHRGDQQRRRLEAEGITFDSEGRVNLRAHRYAFAPRDEDARP